MSNRGDDLSNSKREEFKRYLNELGVIEALTNVLAKLYELETKPIDPLDFIRINMTETVKEREELNRLKEKYDNMVSQIREMEEENINLAQAIKELENYEVELGKSNIVADEYVIDVDE